MQIAWIFFTLFLCKIFTTQKCVWKIIITFLNGFYVTQVSVDVFPMRGISYSEQRLSGGQLSIVLEKEILILFQSNLFNWKWVVSFTRITRLEIIQLAARVVTMMKTEKINKWTSGVHLEVKSKGKNHDAWRRSLETCLWCRFSRVRNMWAADLHIMLNSTR